jgi:hypothetical protein
LNREPAVWEWIEAHPVGRIVAGGVLVAWIALYFVYQGGIWTLDVTFFVAVAALTFGLGVLALLAAVVQFVHRDDNQSPQLYRAPQGLAKGLDDYFRWLTPLAFMTAVVFAHFFWH